jgi:hypothetical protein
MGVCKYMPIIPAFRMLRPEDHKFKISPGYIVRTCLKKKKKQNPKLTKIIHLKRWV